MKSEAGATDPSAVDLPGVLAQLCVGAEVDRTPLHLAGSAWLTHVPFAWWLTKVLRPERLAELGSHAGVSYFAFCQAVVAERLATRCFAIDTWQGDVHAGEYGDEIHAKVAQVNEQQGYASFSSLLRTTFDEAVSGFADGEIDLLHIDGLHTFEAVAHDFATWRPKLSSRAIVLFHDTNVRDRGFGVWRLWQDLSARFPSFEFAHGFGLGVLGIGSDLPAPINQLFEAAKDEARANAIRGFFAARGEAVRSRFLIGETARFLGAEAAQAADAAAGREADLRRRLEDAERESATSRTIIANLRAAEHALRTSTSWRVTRPLRGAAYLFGASGADHPGRAAARAIAMDRLSPARLRIGAATAARRFGMGPAIDRLRGRRPVARDAASVHASAGVDSRAGLDAVWVGGEPDTPGFRYRVVHWANAARAGGYAVRHLRLDEAASHLDAIRQARVVIVWRAAWDDSVARVIDAARSGGATIVFDVDDLMIDPTLARVDVIDGIRSQSLAEKAVQEFYARVQRTMMCADFCTATTEELAAQMRRFGKPAFVLPNGFDEDTVLISALAARRRTADQPTGVPTALFRLGYAGGSRTHQRDFATCAGAVSRFLRQRPDARLVLFRDPASGHKLVDLDEFAQFSGLDAQIEYRDLVSLAELPNEIARFDINLAPLEIGNPFCEAKSELKYFEAALCGVCTIASATGPYARTMRDGETGFLAASDTQWFDALVRLADDSEIRRAIALGAHDDVLWRYGPENRVELARFALEQFMRGRRASNAFSLHRLHDDVALEASAPVVPDSRIEFDSDRLRSAAVTVIVPLYNYEGFIVEALDSVAAQTLSDLDLVIIDDASTDASLAKALEWARAHAARFNRLQVRSNLSNSKLGPTRNTGFDAARTPWVLPLDADNLLLPDFAKTALEVVRRHMAAYAYPAIQHFDADNQVIGNVACDPVRYIGGNYVDAMALVSKAAWLRVGGYHDIRFGWEDFDLWCRFAERGLPGVAIGGAPLARYRVHQGSMLRTTTDVDDNKRRLIADIESRHPWLRIALGESIGQGASVEATVSQAPEAVDARSVPESAGSRLAPESASRLESSPVPRPRAAAGPDVETRDTGDRLERLLPLLRCPLTGLALERASRDELRTVDGSQRWPIVAGRPVFFPEIGEPEIRPVDHVSNVVPSDLLARMRATPGPILNVSAGGTQVRLDHVFEAEVAIFRHTDLVADAHRLPFADRAFEAVVALNAFEHYHDPRLAASEFMRVLKPGGWVFIRTAFLQPEHEAPWHFYNCTRHGLLRWFEGFETETLHVSDNFNPAYSLSWIAFEAEQALRKDVSPSAARAFANAPIGQFVDFWRDESTRTSPIWQSFGQLSQRSQEIIAAGFEYVGRRPFDQD